VTGPSRRGTALFVLVAVGEVVRAARWRWYSVPPVILMVMTAVTNDSSAAHPADERVGGKTMRSISRREEQR